MPHRSSPSTSITGSYFACDILAHVAVKERRHGVVLSRAGDRPGAARFFAGWNRHSTRTGCTFPAITSSGNMNCT